MFCSNIKKKKKKKKIKKERERESMYHLYYPESSLTFEHSHGEKNKAFFFPSPPNWGMQDNRAETYNLEYQFLLNRENSKDNHELRYICTLMMWNQRLKCPVYKGFLYFRWWWLFCSLRTVYCGMMATAAGWNTYTLIIHF